MSLEQLTGKRYRDGEGHVWTVEKGLECYAHIAWSGINEDDKPYVCSVPLMSAKELEGWLATVEPVGPDFYLVTYQTMLTPASSPRTHNAVINMCPGAYWAEALVTLRKSKMHGSTFLQATPITEESYEALRKVQL